MTNTCHTMWNAGTFYFSAENREIDTAAHTRKGTQNGEKAARERVRIKFVPLRRNSEISALLSEMNDQSNHSPM